MMIVGDLIQTASLGNIEMLVICKKNDNDQEYGNQIFEIPFGEMNEREFDIETLSYEFKNREVFSVSTAYDNKLVAFVVDKKEY